MNSLIKTLALCALLGASGGAIAAPALFPNGDFASAPSPGSWGIAGPANFTYPTSDGNPGGYGVIDATSGWGVWVNDNNNGSFIPLVSLGLVAGNGYTFKMDMRIEAGSPNSTLGKLKLEWQGGIGGVFGPDQPALVNNNWNTYTWNVIIPAGVTGMKIVPVSETGSIVGFDNIGFESVPYYVAPLPPPPPSDVVHENVFDVAGTNWGAPTGTPGPVSSVTFSGSEGNPPGSTALTVDKPAGGGADIFMDYTATGVNFGDGPVEISFDGKLLAGFPGTALHVRYNGNFVGAIQGSFNGGGYTTFTRTFNLNQGFSATDTLVLQFQFAMGADPGAGGSISIDNIRVKTNLPGPPAAPTATIEQGTLVSWTAINSPATYQPQESTNNVDWTNLGAAIPNNVTTSRFDDSPAAFYQVVESIPAVFDNAVPNGGFEFNDFEVPLADNWEVLNPPNQGASITVAGSYDGILPHSGVKMLVIESTGPGAPAPNTDARSAQFPVVEGVNYELSFWIANPLKIAGASPQYSLFFYGSEGFLSGGFAGSPTLAQIGSEWTEFTVPVTPPAGAIAMTVGWIQAASAEANVHWVTLIDDVSLSEGIEQTPAATNTLAATKAPAVEISWDTLEGSEYQVKSSGDLSGWSDFGDPVTGDGGTFSVIDLITPPSKFYRVLRTIP